MKWCLNLHVRELPFSSRLSPQACVGRDKLLMCATHCALGRLCRRAVAGAPHAPVDARWARFVFATAAPGRGTPVGLGYGTGNARWGHRSLPRPDGQRSRRPTEPVSHMGNRVVECAEVRRQQARECGVPECGHVDRPWSWSRASMTGTAGTRWCSASDVARLAFRSLIPLRSEAAKPFTGWTGDFRAVE